MKKLSIIAILLLVMSFGIVTGCSKNEGSNTATGKNETGGSSEEDINKKITTSGAVAKDGNLIVFAKNSNKSAVSMEIEVEFYDSNNKIVGNDSTSLEGVGANSEIAVEMSSTPSSWDNYKIYADAKEATVNVYIDKLKISHNNNGDEIVVQTKNNSNDTISEIVVAVVYYQGKTVVGLSQDSAYDVTSGRSGNFTLEYAYDKNYDEVKFDSYKVFVNEAYTD